MNINDDDDEGKAFTLCIIIAIANSRAEFGDNASFVTYRLAFCLIPSQNTGQLIPSYIAAISQSQRKLSAVFNCTAVRANFPCRNGIVQGPSLSSKLSPDRHRQRRGEAFGESSTFCHRVREVPRQCNLRSRGILGQFLDHVNMQNLLD